MAKLNTDIDQTEAGTGKFRPRQSPSRLNERAAQAVKGGDVEALRMWLSAGANPNHSLSLAGTLLRMAADKPDAGMVKALIEAGADPDGPWPETPHAGGPLFGAVLRGSAECVELLLAAGADPDGGRGPGGERRPAPVRAAASQGKDECLRLLGAAGADMDALSDNGQPPLFYALEHVYRTGNARCVTACLAAGADPSLRVRVGRIGGTAPMRALEDDCLEGMRALCEFGFDPSVVDDSGRTVQDKASIAPWRGTATGNFLNAWLLARSEAVDLGEASSAASSEKAKPRL